MITKLSAIIICVAIIISGCAVLEPVKPQEVLKNPLGTGPLKRGMTKNEIRDMWGEPDLVVVSDKSADVTSTSREEWIYQARYSRLPVDTGYLSKTKRLHFDGENLVNWENE